MIENPLIEKDGKNDKDDNICSTPPGSPKKGKNDGPSNDNNSAQSDSPIKVQDDAHESRKAMAMRLPPSGNIKHIDLNEYAELDAPKPEDSPNDAYLKFDQNVWTEMERDPWYHGQIPMEDVDSLLVKDGDFLLRKFDGATQQGVTVRWSGNLFHFPLFATKTPGPPPQILYSFNASLSFPDPIDLTRTHMVKKVAMFQDVMLCNPVPKQTWELLRDDLKLESKIGEGAFGEVWRGLFLGKKYANEEIPVAIKLMKVNANTKNQITKMHQEARLMRQYTHVNVVRLHGLVFADTDAMIVMEMVTGGDLNTYLKKHTELLPLTLTSFSYDAAAGLAYLHKHNCMHRDIASRNCLVDSTGRLVKVSDFGLSVHGNRFVVPNDERVPIRWQAPEVITTRIFTPKCDVWSFGMLMWEIFNQGQMPFTGYTHAVIKKSIMDPKFRPHIPSKCYKDVALVMGACWQSEPQKRPSMMNIAEHLQRFCIHTIRDQEVAPAIQKTRKKDKKKDKRHKQKSKSTMESYRKKNALNNKSTLSKALPDKKKGKEKSRIEDDNAVPTTSGMTHNQKTSKRKTVTKPAGK